MMDGLSLQIHNLCIYYLLEVRNISINYKLYLGDLWNIMFGTIYYSGRDYHFTIINYNKIDELELYQFDQCIPDWTWYLITYREFN